MHFSWLKTFFRQLQDGKVKRSSFQRNTPLFGNATYVLVGRIYIRSIKTKKSLPAGILHDSHQVTQSLHGVPSCSPFSEGSQVTNRLALSRSFLPLFTIDDMALFAGDNMGTRLDEDNSDILHVLVIRNSPQLC